LLRLHSPASCCELLQEPFGLHRRLDAVEHNTDAVGQLFEKGSFARVVKRN